MEKYFFLEVSVEVEELFVSEDFSSISSSVFETDSSVFLAFSVCTNEIEFSTSFEKALISSYLFCP